MRQNFTARTLGVFAVLVLASCFGDGLGPGSAFKANIMLAPNFDNRALMVVDVNRVLVRFALPGTSTVVKEEIADWPAGTDTLTLSIELELDGPSQQFDLTLLLIDDPAGDTLFRSGPELITAVASATPTTLPTAVPLYVGPGSNATGVRFVASPAQVFFGQTAQFTAEAFDANNVVVPTAPITYSSNDLAKADIDPATGQVTAGIARGNVQIKAELPRTSATTPPAEVTTQLVVQPVASNVVVQGGGGQTGPVGGALQPVTVRVLAADNLGVQAVTVNFAVVSGGGSLSAPSAVTNASGDAAVTWTLGPSLGTQTISATVPGLSGGTINVPATGVVGPPAILVYTQAPGSGQAGFALSPAVRVAALDAFGHPTPAFTGAVTLAIVANPGSATLSGGGPVNAVAGEASFPAVTLSAAGTGYTLSASATGLASVTSPAFNITTPVPTQLAFGQQPTNAIAGGVIAPAVTVAVKEAGGQTIPGATNVVSLTIANNAGGGTLSGTTSVAAVNGIATFTDLSIDRTGSGYTLSASSGVLTGATSAAFDITSTTPQSLEFVVQPGFGQAGVPISPAIQVRARDGLGNTATGFTGNVSLAFGANPGSATLSGTTTVAAVAGVATFNNVMVSAFASGYTLVASAASLTDATSGAFTIAPPGATKVWLGGAAGTPTDWRNAANWSPAGVPGGTDNVFIPVTANQPVITPGSNVSIGALDLASGTTLTTDGNGLNATGNISALGTITGGPLNASGSGVSLRAANLAGGLFVTGSVSLSGPVTTTQVASSGLLILNGQTLTATNFGMNSSAGPGSRLRMQNPADRLVVSGDIGFGGDDSNGELTAGVIELGGTLNQFGPAGGALSPQSYFPTGSHVLRLTGSGLQFLNFQNAGPGAGASHLNHLELAGTGTAGFNGDVFATGQLRSPAGATTLNSPTGSTLHVAGLDVDGLTLNNALVSSSGGTITRFDNVTFQGYSSALTPLVIAHPGAAAPFVFSNLQWLVTPTTGGHYLDVADANTSDGLTLTIELAASNPADGTAATGTSGGAVVTWLLAPTVRTWTGAVSTDWSNAANWSSGVVPAATDSVLVPVTGNSPVLTTDVTIARLTVETGTTLSVATHNLIVNGSVVADGPVTGAGTLTMAGPGSTVQGTVPNLAIAANVMVIGNLTVTGDIANSGVFNVNGRVVTVAGNFTNQGGGGSGTRLVMQDPSSQLTVAGNVVMQGDNQSGSLTDGTFDVGGNFTQSNLNSSPQSFFPTGTFRTRFIGGTLQAITFQDPGPGAGASHFRHLDIANPAGVTLASNIAVTGNVTMAAGTLTGNVTATLAGNLSDGTGNLWRPLNTIVTGATPSLANMQTNLTFTCTCSLNASFTITGDAAVNGGMLTVNGQTLTITGQFQVQGGGGSGSRLRMTNAADRVTVQGNMLFEGDDEAGHLIDGLLEVGGNFTQSSLNNSFQSYFPAAAHTLRLMGAGPQAITFQHSGSGAGASHFANLDLAGSGDVTFSQQLFALGQLRSPPGATTLHGGGNALNVLGLDVDGLTLDNVLLNSAGGTLARFDNIAFQSHAATSTPLIINHPGAATPFAFTGVQWLVSPSGAGHYLDITDSNTGDGLTFTIDMVASNPPDGSAATGTSGGAVVNWTASSLRTWSGAVSSDWNVAGNWAGGTVPGPTQDVVIAPGTPNAPTLTVDATISSITVQAGAVLNNNAFELDVTGDADATGGITGTGSVRLSGTGRTARGTFPNLEIAGTYSAAGAITVGAFLTVNGGVFDLNGQTVTVAGDLATTGTGVLVMDQAADAMIVNGSASFAGVGAGAGTAGTLTVRGNFAQVGAGLSYVNAGTFLTVLDGTGVQLITFDNPGQSLNRFQNVQINNASASVTINSAVHIEGTLALIAANLPGTGSLTVTGDLQVGPSAQVFVPVTLGGALLGTPASFAPPTMTFAGSGQAIPPAPYQNVSVQGNAFFSGNVTIAGNLAVGPTSALLDINSQSVTVAGSLTTSGSGALIMASAASVLTVAGSATFGGVNAGAGTAGTLNLAGDFSQAGAGNSYVNSGTFRTVLNGAAFQQVGFANPGAAANHFHHLEINKPSGSVQLMSTVVATGELRSATAGAESVLGNGNRLDVAGLDVDGLVLDNVRLVSTDGALTRFDNVTLQNHASDVTPLVISHPGAATPFVMNDTRFLVTPTTGGFYLEANDDVADANFLTVNLQNSTPADGSAQDNVTGGAFINWLSASSLRTWTGAGSTNWQTAGNWSNNAVPLATEDVLIPAGTPNSPQLTAPAAARALTVASGAVLDLGTFVIAVAGNLHVDGGITGGAGAEVSMVNTGPVTIHGAIPALRTTDNQALDLNGALTVSGNLTIDGAGSHLKLNGRGVTIGGNFTTQNGGRLMMVNPADVVNVGGDATFAGADETSLLEAGGISLLGNFTQAGDPNAFVSTGTLVMFAGTGTQNVSFANPGPASSRFNNVSIAGSGTVFLQTAVFASGVVSSPTGAQTIASSSGRALTTSGFSIDGLTFDNVTLISQGGFLGQFFNVTFQNLAPSATALTIDHDGATVSFDNTVFNFSPAQGTGFYVRANDTNPGNAVPLVIDLLNSTPPDGTANEDEQNGASINWVLSGVHTWTGAVSTDWETAGNWNQGTVPPPTEDAIIPSGRANNPVLANFTQIKNITVQAGATLTLGTRDLQATGNVDATGGLIGTGSVMMISGGPATVRGSIPNLVVSEDVSLDGPLQTGFLGISGSFAKLRLNGNTAIASSNMTIDNQGLLVMTNPADLLQVGGNANFRGADHTGSLTAGTILVLGNIQSTLATSLVSTGTRFQLMGTGPQTLSLQAGSSFRDLILAGSGGVTLLTDVTATGQLVVNGPVGALTGSGQLLSVSGLDVSVLDLDGVRLASNGGVITRFDNVSFDGYNATDIALDIAHDGAATPFTFNNLEFFVPPTTPPGAYLRATDTNTGNGQTLTINLLGTNPQNGTANTLTAGGAVVNWILTGLATWTGAVSTDWNTPGNWLAGSVPAATDNVMIPAGRPSYPALSGPITVQDLTIEAGASLAPGGGDFTVNGHFLNQGVITSTVPIVMAGASRTMLGTVPILRITGTIGLNGNLLVTDAMEVTGSGEFTLSGLRLDVQGTLMTSGSGALIMQAPGDVVSVSGDVTLAGSNPNQRFTNGVLELQGNLHQVGAGPTFAASGSHVTRLLNDANQTITFDDPANNQFNAFAIQKPGSNVTLAGPGPIRAIGQFSRPAASPVTVTGVNLQVAGLDVDGLVLDGLTLTSTDGNLARFDNVTFVNTPAIATALTITHPGNAAPLQFNNVVFQSLPTAGGLYFALNDNNAGNGLTLQVDMNNPTPATPGPFSSTGGGAVLNWPFTASFTWTGAVSTDWHNQSNWSTNAVPTSTDNVVIPSGTPNAPVVTSAANVAALTLQPGATLTVTGAQLTASGNVDAGTTISGTGTLLLDGAGSTIRGTVGNLEIADSVALSGDLVVTGDLTISGATARLTVGGDNVTVQGSLVVQNSGLLVMASSGGDLSIAGSALFAGGDQTGRLTAGRISVGGDFTQSSTSSVNSFVSTGTRVTLTGGGAQAMSHDGNALFASLVVGKGGGAVNVTGGIVVTDSLVIDTPTQVGGAGTASVMRRVRTVAGSNLALAALAVNADSLQVGGAYTVSITTINGGAVLPAITYNNLQIVSSSPLTNTAPVTVGNVLQLAGPVFTLGNSLTAAGASVDAGELVLNGHTATFGSSGFTVNGNALLTMTNAADTLAVAGPAVFAGADQTGRLTAGVMRLSDALAQLNFTSPSSLISQGTRVELVGAADQNVSFTSTGLGASDSRLRDLVINKPGGQVLLGSDVFLNGRVDVQSATSVSGSFALFLQGRLATGASSPLVLNQLLANADSMAVAGPFSVGETSYFDGFTVPVLAYQNLTLFSTGAPVSMPGLTVLQNLTLTGGVQLELSGAPVSVGATLQVENGSRVVVNGSRLDVADQLRVLSDGVLEMTNALDSVTVQGPALFDGGDHSGWLTSGVLVFMGDFQQSASTSNLSFAATGTRVRFAGGPMQNARFDTPDSTMSRFAGVIVSTGGNMLFQTKTFVMDSLLVLSPANVNVETSQGLFVRRKLTTLAGSDFSAVLLMVNADSLQVGGGFGSQLTRVRFTGGATIPSLNYAGIQVATGQATTVAGTLNLSDVLTALTVTGAGTVFTLPVSVHQVDGGVLVENGGRMVMGGATMHVINGSSLATQTGGIITMTNPGDQLNVSGNVTWAGDTHTGHLTAGTLRIAGNFTEAGNTGAFDASGSHVTEFNGGVQDVLFSAPGQATTSSHFNDLLVSTGEVRLNSPVFVNRQLLDGSVATERITGVGGQSLVVGGANVNVMILDNVRLLIDTLAALTGFDNVTFDNNAATDIQLEVRGLASQTKTFNNLVFNALPSTGLYLLANGPFTTTFNNPTPANPGGFISAINGATINWGSLNFWTNTSGGSWNTPSNWSRGTVPTVGETAVIDAAGTYTVTLDVLPLFNALTVGGGSGVQTLSVPPSQTLQVNAGQVMTVASSGALNLAGGRITGSATITVDGAFNWSSGHLSGGGGKVLVNGTGAITGSAAVIDTLRAYTLEIGGVVAWSGENTIQGHTSTLRVLPSGTLNVTGNNPRLWSIGGPLANFNNQGTVNRTTGNAAFYITTTVDGDGTFNVNSGTGYLDLHIGNNTFTGSVAVTAPSRLVIRDTPHTFGPTSSITGTGGVEVTQNAALNVQGTYNISGLTKVAFGAVGPGTLTFSTAAAPALTGALQADSGQVVMNGQGLIVSGNLSTVGSGTVSMTHANDSIVVGGNATFNGNSQNAAGLLSAGKLRLLGNFTQGANSLAYQAFPAHITEFAGAAVQTVSFASPDSSGGSTFGELRLAKTGGQVTMTTDAFVAGQLTQVASAGTIASTNHALTLQGANATNVTFDNTRVAIADGAALPVFNFITFQNMNAAATQLDIARSTGSFSFFNHTYATTPTGGLYLRLNGPFSVTMLGANPANCSSFCQAIGGATLNWP